LTSPEPSIAGFFRSVMAPLASWPPRMVGPIRMPAMISPTTRGCLNRTKIPPTIRAAIRMIARSART
jgi:hypothetical protein